MAFRYVFVVLISLFLSIFTHKNAIADQFYGYSATVSAGNTIYFPNATAACRRLKELSNCNSAEFKMEPNSSSSGDLLGYSCGYRLGLCGFPAEYWSTTSFTCQRDDGSLYFGKNFKCGYSEKPDPLGKQCKLGNPTQVETGSKYDRVVDYRSNAGIPFEISRQYRAEVISQKNSGGLQWRFSFDWYLHKSFTDITLVSPSGTAYHYTHIGSSLTRQSQKHADVSLSYVGGEYRFRDVNDTVAVFKTINGTRRIDNVTYRSGLKVTYNYTTDPNDSDKTQLTSLSDNFGRTFNLTWAIDYGHELDGQVDLQKIEAPGGIVLDYTYTGKETYTDTNNVVHSVNGTGVIGSVKVSKTGTTDEETTTYHYDPKHGRHLLTGITDARGVRYSTYTYDDRGRVLTSEHAGGDYRYTFSYDNDDTSTSTDGTTTVTNPLGKQTIYKYRSKGQSGSRYRRLTSVDGVASANCPATNSAYVYDSKGLETQTTDRLGRITKYVRNSRGLPTTITEADGTADQRVTNYTWHSTLKLPTEITAPRLKSEMTYNSIGQVTQLKKTDLTTHTAPYSTQNEVRQWDFTYDTNGLLTSVDGPLAGTGDTTTYGYDTNGQVTSVTNELGQITQITAHTVRGLPETIIDPNGIKTNLEYDFQGRLTKITSDVDGTPGVTEITNNPVGQVTKVVFPDGVEFNYAYNDARRLTSITNASGEKITYTRNAYGSITKVEYSDNASAVTFRHDQQFDELNRLLKSIGNGEAQYTFENTYDKEDNLTSVKNPRDLVYNYAYDNLNRLKTETSPENDVVEYTRDASDNVSEHKDPRQLSTTYVRNGFGDVIERTSPDSGVTIYWYDARGLMTKMQDARGVVTDYAYDNAGRITSKSYPAATAENVTYVYDSVAGGNEGVGRLTSMTDQSGSTSFVYDARGNVVTQTKVINGVTYTSSYAYDTSNKLTQMTYPSGRIMTYGYDAEGRVNLIQTQVNAAAPVVTLSSNVTYKPFSRLVQNHDFSNGLNEWNNHDALYNIDQLGLYDGGTLVDQRTMTRADSLNLTNIFHNGASSKDETIYYNNSNWIQNASGPYGDFTYYQDGVGNMTWRIRDVNGTVTSEQLGYNGVSNRVLDVFVGGAATRTFQYDAAGNITQDVRAGVGTYNYTYNNANRLSSVKLGTQDVGTYTYDGLSRLARRIVQNSGSANGNRQYIYDLYGNLIVEADDFGNTVREYIWFAQDIATSTLKTGVVPGFRPVAVVDDVDTTSPKLYHVHVDHVNRPVMMTDSTKAKVWEASYLPFGGVNNITGSASMNARFPGQWFQLESGLHYNWHRHYDATIARYTQPDPIGLAAGPSVYAYVTNSPHVYTDPEGLDTAVGAGLGGAVAGPPGAAVGAAVGLGATFGAACYANQSCRNFANQCLSFAASPTKALDIMSIIMQATGGKKAADSSKNEPHGDGGRAREKAKKQIKELEDKLANAKSKRDKKEIRRKIRNIRKAADRKYKGESHHN